MNLTRRTVLAGTGAAIGAGLGLSQAWAQASTLTVLSHKVHESVARGQTAGTTGGDIAGEWAQANSVELNWVTGNIDPIHDRLGRELSLGESSVDLAFIINKFHTPRIAALLEPLDSHIEAEPIEILDSIPEAMKKALTHEGQLTAIPMRHATTGLHWNRTLFAEQGLDRAPETLDELLEFARKMSYTRSDGTYVQGHWRSSPDSSYNNNYSTQGNYNPYTGQSGTQPRTWNDNSPQSNQRSYGNPGTINPVQPSTGYQLKNQW